MSLALNPKAADPVQNLLPHNISVVLTQWSPPAVRISWAYGSTQDQQNPQHTKNIDGFRIVYNPINSRYRFIQEVPQHVRNITIERLLPNTEYQLLITAITNTEVQLTTLFSNSSKFVRFISPDSEPHRFWRNGFNPLRIRLDNDSGINVRPTEVLIVVMVLFAWFGVIFLFIKKWGKIRTLEPTRSRTNEDYPEFSQKMRYNSTIPQVHTTISQTSIKGMDFSPRLYDRPRLNSVFLASPSRRNSLLPFEYTAPRRYKSAEDLKSLVVQITQQKVCAAVPPKSEAAL
ncbi:ephrin type-A receptor 7-like protein [Dinothrombium tinctorium]|uniref:Ephrin type-A receptor 7-like protein n=1 Tax=Dinothrombium tinctorium TaxID=1965070 RepID=A0A3S3PMJ5_9ACAR|nr:ephrin type-A receptor 7-like protein [Dinothrombium tinctorium]